MSLLGVKWSGTKTAVFGSLIRSAPLIFLNSSMARAAESSLARLTSTLTMRISPGLTVSRPEWAARIFSVIVIPMMAPLRPDSSPLNARKRKRASVKAEVFGRCERRLETMVVSHGAGRHGAVGREGLVWCGSRPAGIPFAARLPEEKDQSSKPLGGLNQIATHKKIQKPIYSNPNPLASAGHLA